MSCKETFPVFSQPHPWCGFLLESPPNTSPTTHNKSPFGRIFALRAKRAATAHVTSAIAALSINSEPPKSTQKLSAAGFCPAPRTAPHLVPQHGRFKSTRHKTRLRKVRGGRGRFGGRGSPLRKGAPSPSKVSFSLLPLPLPSNIAQHEGNDKEGDGDQRDEDYNPDGEG